MLDFDLVNGKVRKITGSPHYEGDFGDVVEDAAVILSNVESSDIKKHFPSDYLKFIKCVGFGELDASFYFDDGPSHYMKTYGRSIDKLDGMYVFASDQSEYVFAFDSKNNWQVVDVDSSGDVENIIARDFAEFIDVKLNDLIEIVDWREKNF
jgi:hypothetical protein